MITRTSRRKNWARMQLWAHYGLLLLLNVFALRVSAAETIIVPLGTDHNSMYAKELLSLIVDKADRPYKIKLAEFDNLITQERAIQNTQDGNIDVMWTVTNPGIESRLIPVRIPLFKGLFGYRISLVHASNRDLFRDVKTLDQLREISFGQGIGWTDTSVLLSNKLKVTQSAKWQGLFHMVDGGRFEAYPRGLHEPDKEMAMIRDWGLDLVVDEHIVLVYRLPFYLFVTPKRPELARDLEQAFERFVASGEFGQFFIERNDVKALAKRVNLSARHPFYLDNPHLPAETPIEREELWLESVDVFQ